MPTQVIQSGGGGFFDAASKAYESGAERGTDFYVQQQSLEQQQEALKLETKKFELTQQAEMFRQRQLQDELNRRQNAFAASLPQLQARGLIGMDVTEETIRSMDVETLTSTIQSIAQTANLDRQGQLMDLEIGSFEARNASALALERAQRLYTEAQTAEIPERLSIAQRDLALREAEFVQNYTYNNATLAMNAAGLAQELGLSPADMNTQLFGNPQGPTARLIAQDRAEWEALPAENRPSLGEFMENKRFDRVAGVFRLGVDATAELRQELQDKPPTQVFEEVAAAEYDPDSPEAIGQTAVLYALKTLYPDIRASVPAVVGVTLWEKVRPFIQGVMTPYGGAREFIGPGSSPASSGTSFPRPNVSGVVSGAQAGMNRIGTSITQPAAAFGGEMGSLLQGIGQALSTVGDPNRAP